MTRPAATRRAHQRADQRTIRRSNLALVLRHLRSTGPVSRARVAVQTGLNKSTVSSLVDDLARRGLVRIGDPAREGRVGRPGHVLGIDPSGATGVGLELEVDHLSATVLDLDGSEVFARRVPLDAPALPQGEVLDRLGALGREAVAVAQRESHHLAGVTVAAPGMVDGDRGVLLLAPNLGWRDVPLADELGRRLGLAGPDVGQPTPQVGNEANLGGIAVARALAAEHGGVDDFVYVSGGVGVGGGAFTDGHLVRGTAGLAGEVGHLPIDPGGRLCGCGRRGCWETAVGFGALLRTLGGHPDRTDLPHRTAEVVSLAEAGDARALDALREVGTALGLGAAVLADLLNPSVVFFGGWFAELWPWLSEPAAAELHRRAVAPDAGGCRLEPSPLGFDATVLGAAHVALAPVFADPSRVPVRHAATSDREPV